MFVGGGGGEGVQTRCNMIDNAKISTCLKPRHT